MPPKEPPQDREPESSTPETDEKAPLSPEEKRKRDLEDFHRITDPSIREKFYGL